MAYISQETKKSLAPSIKAVLKKYGVKGTIGINHHSTLVVNISAGKIDFFKNYNDTARSDRKVENYMDINPYWYDTHFSGVAKDFLTELMGAMKGANWYNNSDIMTDYFDIAYYIDVNVGRWDKPYNLEA